MTTPLKLTKIGFAAQIVNPDNGLPNAHFTRVLNDGLSSIESAYTDLATQVTDIAAAQTSANNAQTTANSATTAAAAAQAAADAAQTSADAANTELSNWAADNLLTPVEKKGVIRDYQAIIAEQSDIDSKATAYSITTEKTNYDNAVSALTTYLNTLVSPVLWSNLSNSTTIVGTTFTSKFNDVYLKRQLLLNRIAQAAGLVAAWTGVTGTPSNLTALGGTEAIQNTLVPLGQNVVANSDFAHTGDLLYGWATGAQVGGLSLDRGVNINSSYSGQLNVAWVHAPGTLTSGQWFDSYTQAGDPVPSLDALKRWALPVFDGDSVFASCLLARHRCNSYLNIHFYDGSGAYLTESTSSMQGRSLGAGNGDPANFDRATLFAQAPTNARYANMRIRAFGDSEADPYIFFTQMMLCKVAAGQTVAPTYNSGPADRSATYGADLGANVTGRLTNGGGTMPVNWNGGIKSINTGFALSDTVVDSSTCQINISATTWQFDNGTVVNYPTGTITGCAYATTYYVYRTDASLNGGTAYGASTNIGDAQSTSKVYFGYLTTRTDSGTSTGGTGGGGGLDNCVAIDAFVPTERGLLPAHEVVAGDRVRTLTKSLNGTAWETVEANEVGDNYCVRIKTKSASLTLAHNTPIIDRNGAWTMAANAHACHLPVLVDGDVVWEKCESVEHVGLRPVMKLRCHQAIYAAGDTRDAFILTHNLFGDHTYKP